jgi:hypothetical protein
MLASTGGIVSFVGAILVRKQGGSMLRKSVWLMAVVVLIAGGASAQDPRVEISGNAGWTLSDGVSGQAILAPDGNLYDRVDPKDSFSYNFTLGFFFSENWELEFIYDRQESTLVAGGTAEREVGDLAVSNYHGAFVYNFGDSDASVRPYAFGGLGATSYGRVSFTGITGQPLETDGETQFSSTWGLGVKIYPGRSAGLKLGVRWTPTYIKSDFAGVWCDPYWGWCYTLEDAQYSNQFELTGGITLRF